MHGEQKVPSKNHGGQLCSPRTDKKLVVLQSSSDSEDNFRATDQSPKNQISPVHSTARWKNLRAMAISNCHHPAGDTIASSQCNLPENALVVIAHQGQYSEVNANTQQAKFKCKDEDLQLNSYKFARPRFYDKMTTRILTSLKLTD